MQKDAEAFTKQAAIRDEDEDYQSPAHGNA